MKKVIVLSLGGSQIIKDNKINLSFLKKFKKILKQHSKNYKFVVVCGGGSVARMYIQGLREIKASNKLQSFAGISVTRTNARFMSYFFKLDPEKGIPHKMKEIKKYLKKQNFVFCGALGYKPNQTSDSTASLIAKKFGSEFINVTNVDGLFDKNPKKYKSAKFIKEISWKDFFKMANSIKFSPGQHFVLDQNAAKIILEEKIKTYIVGNNLNNLDKLLLGQNFRGSVISG